MIELCWWVRVLFSYGMVFGVIVVMVIGWLLGEYFFFEIEYGFMQFVFVEMWNYLLFSIGMLDVNVFLFVVLIVVIVYIIVFGDIIVGKSVLVCVDYLCLDEDIEVDVDCVYLVIGFCNLIYSFFVFFLGLVGLLFIGVMVMIVECYCYGC